MSVCIYVCTRIESDRVGIREEKRIELRRQEATTTCTEEGGLYIEIRISSESKEEEEEEKG